MKNEIKAIIFDFVGVLLFERSGYAPDYYVDEADKAIGRMDNDDEFKAKITKKFSLGEKEFDSLLRRIVNKYEPLLPLWSLLPELRRKYKLAVINNGTALTLAKFQLKYEINEKFDLFISSAIEGIGKPDKEIYLRAAGRLNVKPEDCLFMDDSLKNVRGAQTAGMQTIWWRNRESGFERFVKYLNLESL